MSRPSLTLPTEIGAAESHREEVVVGRRTDGGDRRPTIVQWFETWATGGRDRQRH